MRRLKGKKFGRLTVIGKAPRPANVSHRSAMWECECECGGTIIAMAPHLLSGATRSCGCLKREARVAAHPLYKYWRDMVDKCHDPEHPEYSQFGAKGIRVSPQWRASFEKFKSDIGTRPAAVVTLHRSDLKLSFTQSNLKWHAQTATTQPQIFYAAPPTGEPPTTHSNMAAFRRKYKVPIKEIPADGTVKELHGWRFWR